MSMEKRNINSILIREKPFFSHECWCNIIYVVPLVYNNNSFKSNKIKIIKLIT